MSEEESEKLIEYKTKAFHSAIDDLYKCESYFIVRYDSSTCMPYIKYDPECQIPKPLDTSLNSLYLEKFNQLPYDLIREKRGLLLKESDWIGLTDVSLINKEAWQTYRQALRDLPQNSTPELDENGELTNVTWPTPPS